jgi:hypothetical protein
MTGTLETQVTANQVEALYVAYFDRAADGPGQQYWTTQMTALEAKGDTPAQAAVLIAQSFAVQPEAASLHVPTDPTQATAVAAFIQQTYSNLFSHTPDAPGLAYWQGQITSGAVPLGAAVYDIANGATGNDATITGFKIIAAVYFTTETTAFELLGTPPAQPLPNFFLAEAHAAVANVVDATSLQSSEAATNAFVAQPGTTEDVSLVGQPAYISS